MVLREHEGFRLLHGSWVSVGRQGTMERPGLAHTCAAIIDGKYDPTTQARTLRVHHRGADQTSNGSIHGCASTLQDVPVEKMEEKRQC